ncbi:copia protein [Tanacetum coccineum]
MAAHFLAIPITTVASEATFSAGGRVIDTYCASLDPETVQALICGGDWIRKLHGVKKKNKVSLQVCALVCGNGPVWNLPSYEFDNFSAPRTPQSNGVVERKNRTLQEMSRTMLNEQSLPQKFWCNALFQMDVKSTFLSSFINEEVYVAQPLGFIDFEKLDHVYKLKKALYGLEQAPTARWSLDELAYGVLSEGPYQTNLPSLDDIISYIQEDQEGQVTHIRHMEEIELSNESYVLYDRVMNPLGAQQERKTRKDFGTRRGRHSTSSSSAFGQPSSSHLNDDDDGNDEGTSRASTPSPIRYVNSLTNEVPQVFQNPPNVDSHLEPFYTRQTKIINRQVQIRDEHRGGLRSIRKGLRNLWRNKSK